MTKKQLARLVFCGLLSWAGIAEAQQARYTTTANARKEMMEKLQLEVNPSTVRLPQARLAPVSPTPTTPGGGNRTSNLQVVAIGTASNAYTILRTGQNQVVADQKTGTVGWIHRQDVNLFAGGAITTANGIPRFDHANISNLDNWTLNAGPLAPLPYTKAPSSRLRYPIGALHVPQNATSVNDLSLIWMAGITDGSGWGNIAWGSARNIGQLEALGTSVADPKVYFDFLGTDQQNKTLIPNGIVQGKPGEFWAIDLQFVQTSSDGQGNYLNDINVFKGVYNATANTITFQKNFNGVGQTLGADDGLVFDTDAENTTPTILGCNIAFDPSGNNGWIVVITDRRDPARPNDGAVHPVFYRTQDGGTTWTGPFDAYLPSIATIKQYIPEEVNVAGSPDPVKVQPFCFDADLVVDKNGNPHAFVKVATGIAAPFSASNPKYSYYPDAPKQVWDITSYDQGKTFCPILVDSVIVNTASISGSDLNWNNSYVQVSRDDVGEHIFYSWTDNKASTGSTDANPNAYERALRLSDYALTPVRSLTIDDATYSGKIYFPTLAPITLKLGNGDFLMPTVFLDGLKFQNELNTCEFSFMKNRTISATAFVAPQVDLSISATSPASGTVVCFQSEQAISFTVKNEASAAAFGTATVSYSYLSNGQVVRVEQPLQLNGLAPGATVNVNFTTPANISASGTYVISASVDLPGDGNCQNSNRDIVLTNFGGSASELFVESTKNGCGSLTLTTGLDPTLVTVSWTYSKDGGAQQTVNSAELLLDQQGAYSVQVSAVATCGGSQTTLNDNLTVNVYPNPVVTIAEPRYQSCSGNPISLNADDTNNPELTATWLNEAGGVLSTSKAYTIPEPANKASRFVTARLVNTQTQCVTEQEVEVRYWKVTLDSLRLRSYYCGSALISALSNNPSALEFGGQQVCTFKFERKNAAGGYEELQSGNQPSYKTEIDRNDQPTTYRVTITPPNGCAPVSKEYTLQTHGIGRSQFRIVDAATGADPFITQGSNKLLCAEKPFRVLYEGFVEDNDGAKIDGLEAFSWEWSPSSAFSGNNRVLSEADGQPVTSNNQGTAARGSVTAKGAKDLVFTYPNGQPGRKTFRLTVYGSPGGGDSTGNTCRAQQEFVFDVIRTTTDSRCVVSRNEQIATFFAVYPNPSQAEFTVELDLVKSENVMVRVLDITGREVRVETLRPVDNKINHQIRLDQPAGVYFLEVQTATGKLVERIVKY
jgi:hypothetical protein